MDASRKFGCGLAIAGGLVGVATAGLFIWLIFARILGMATNAERIALPAGGVVHLEQPGTYTIFHEYKSVHEGTVIQNPETISGLTLRLIEQESGTPVPLKSGASGTYSFGAYEAYALFEVTIPQAGDYRLEGDLPGSVSGPVVIAVTPGITGQIFGTVFGAIALMFGGLGLAAILLISGVILMVRSRAAQPA